MSGSDSPDAPFQCPVPDCGSSFESQRGLSGHISKTQDDAHRAEAQRRRTHPELKSGEDPFNPYTPRLTQSAGLPSPSASQSSIDSTVAQSVMLSDSQLSQVVESIVAKLGPSAVHTSKASPALQSAVSALSLMDSDLDAPRPVRSSQKVAFIDRLQGKGRSSSSRKRTGSSSAYDSATTASSSDSSEDQWPVRSRSKGHKRERKPKLWAKKLWQNIITLHGSASMAVRQTQWQNQRSFHEARRVARAIDLFRDPKDCVSCSHPGMESLLCSLAGLIKADRHQNPQLMDQFEYMPDDIVPQDMLHSSLRAHQRVSSALRSAPRQPPPEVNRPRTGGAS